MKAIIVPLNQMCKYFTVWKENIFCFFGRKADEGPAIHIPKNLQIAVARTIVYTQRTNDRMNIVIKVRHNRVCF